MKSTGVPFKRGYDPRRGCGKRGRSGRRPQRFKQFTRALYVDPVIQQVIADILKNPNHKHFPLVFSATLKVMAIAIDLWPIAVSDCGALGICAVRVDNFEELHQRRIHLERMAGTRLKALPERWTAEAAIAWDNALMVQGTASTEPITSSTLNELRRRDVDNWLRLDLEAVYIKERIGASRLLGERARIAAEAERFHALAIRDAARAQ